MIRHKRNEIKKQVEIPVYQIKYDPVKVKERLNKIKKKRTIINSSLTAVPFGLLIGATVLFLLFLLIGDSAQVETDRIFKNLKYLCYRNREIIVAHSKANFLSVKKIAISTFFVLIIPNCLVFYTGLKELIGRTGTNIYLEYSIKQLWSCVAVNGLAIWAGCKQLISNILKNFLSISQGIQRFFYETGEKIQQIRK
ncbi:MAG: hypothetical protein KH290_13420 [Roseburia sp.]|nr:hypothetical protein [Roseburia sp.]